MRRRRSIVVGVDGTESARDALDWAAAEAAVRRLPLRVVHAYAATPSWAVLGELPKPYDGIGAPDAARLVTEQAVQRARSVASELEIHTRLLIGTGAHALLAQGAEAELLVLGSRGVGGARGLFGGSVSFRVAMHAACPVVVVRPMRATTQGRSATRVVVGVDGSHRSGRAVEFALRAAAQRGVGVTAVHAWSPRGEAGLAAVTEDWSLAEAAEWRTLQRVFSPWGVQVLGEQVELRLARGRPQDVLVAESAGAALVVVGSRGRGSVRAALTGSVSQAVLRRASCPVVVARG
ncbi:universal stress protein [Amycolatopsis sp. NBRC 101858]|uniref:universal stress protein n=1 Tax=Amycolatopsis sp. NBRC 101858 TaxID=3032200 RepID=UPI0024A294FB|nr:universal stress protein [Amycolatopsis sp. NBRC 101858]GLY42804.1 universal stress protein [Amycolatopsis sp. NBRC 101858]